MKATGKPLNYAIVIILGLGLMPPAIMAAQENAGAGAAQASENTQAVQRNYREVLAERELKSLIQAHEQQGMLDVETEIRGRTAYLSGTVDSNDSKELATDLALRVEGINRVVNRLKVERDAEGELRPVDEPDLQSSRDTEITPADSQFAGTLPQPEEIGF